MAEPAGSWSDLAERAGLTLHRCDYSPANIRGAVRVDSGTYIGVSVPAVMDEWLDWDLVDCVMIPSHYYWVSGIARPHSLVTGCATMNIADDQGRFSLDVPLRQYPEGCEVAAAGCMSTHISPYGRASMWCWGGPVVPNNHRVSDAFDTSHWQRHVEVMDSLRSHLGDVTPELREKLELALLEEERRMLPTSPSR